MSIQNKFNFTLFICNIILVIITSGCETTPYVISEPESDPVWGHEYGRSLTAGISVNISSQENQETLANIRAIAQMDNTTDKANALLDISQQTHLSKNAQYQYAKTAFDLDDSHKQAITLRALIRHRDFHTNTWRYISDNLDRITFLPDQQIITNELNKTN